MISLPSLFWVVYLWIFFLTAFFIVLTACLQIKYRFLSRREIKFRAYWEPILASYSVGSIHSPGCLPKAERDLFVRFWNHYQESVRGDAKENLDLLVKNLFLNEYLIKNLRSWNLKRKLDAIIAVGHLRDSRAQSILLKLVKNRHVTISIMAMRSLLQINSQKYVSFFISEILKHPRWPASSVASILKEVGANTFSVPLAQIASSVSDVQKLLLLRYFSLSLPEVATPALIGFLSESKNPEVLLIALKQLSFPGIEPNTIHALLSHSDVSIRRETVITLGRIASLEELPLLSACLIDRAPEVRYQAAHVLVRLPWITNDKLEDIMKNQPQISIRSLLHQSILEKQFYEPAPSI